jgi:hypothetical protein
MSLISVSGQTAQVTTGNVRTSIDAFDSTKPNNGAVNPIGMKYFDSVGSLPTSSGGTAVLTFPGYFGAPVAYRYVRFKGTAAPAINTGPALVWWQDATFTSVTPTKSEAIGGGNSFPAGFLMLNSTDVSTMTTAILNGGGNGSFVWIAVAGLVKSAVSAATAAGDKLMGGAADWATNGGSTIVTATTAATSRIAGYAVAASPADVLVVIEGL